MPEGPPPPAFHWGDVDGVNYLTQAKNQHIPQVPSFIAISVIVSNINTFLGGHPEQTSFIIIIDMSHHHHDYFYYNYNL